MMTTPQHFVETQDAGHIVKVLANLDCQHHTLSATFDSSGFNYSAALTQVDAAEKTLALRIVDAQSLEPTALVGSTCCLYAKGDHSLYFEQCMVQQAKRLDDDLVLFCALPLNFYASATRESARIRLRKDMPVKALMAQSIKQPPISAYLENISLGGCSIMLALSQCTAFRKHTELSSFTLIFPNGEQLSIRASVRYLHPLAGTFRVAMGVAFVGLSSRNEQQLLHIIHDTEREIAWREGAGSYLTAPTQLYNPTSDEEGQSRPGKARLTCYARRPPAVLKVLREEVVRPLHLFLLALLNGYSLPITQLQQGANTLIFQLRNHRQELLFALSFLTDEPNWIQHSINVAVRLADMVMHEPAYADSASPIVMAALIHDLGKALLMDEMLPSLDSEMNEHQRRRVRGHVAVLLAALERANYPLCQVQREIINDINEHLDGSGCPKGTKAEKLSPLARMASVVDAIDAMTRRRGDRTAYTAIDAYRYLYQREQRFDRHWVSRYIQRQGFYPIGSLVRFSRGYLAWVVGLNDHGEIIRLRVVKNIYLGNLNYDDDVSRYDFQQLGHLEGLARPETYGL